MISVQMQQLINHLIQVEHISSFLYQAMAQYFGRINLMGMAHWLQLQREEEFGHAQQLMNYLVNRGGTVEIRAIPSQPTDYGSPLEAFQQVLAHEQSVTEAYRKAYEATMAAQDYQTLPILQDLLREQTEEVAQAMIIVGRLQIAQNNPAALLILDEELGRRTAPE